MKFKNLLEAQSAVIPNMFNFITSSSISLECIVGICESGVSVESVGLANQSIKDGICLLGGQYYPYNTSIGPLTLSEALNALESIQGHYPGLISLRAGTLVEFVNYIYCGGQVTYNCLVVGDEQCHTYFQFFSRDSVSWLSAPSRTEYPSNQYQIMECHGIFVVAELRT